MVLRECTEAIFCPMNQSRLACLEAEICAIGAMPLFLRNRCNAVVSVQARLAKEAREHAITALELEPGSDLAHHLMGRQGC